jgi:hypothetical protein
MRVRRALTVSGAVASLVLLGGPAWADETPAPTSTSDGVVDPAGNPDCFLVPGATDEPTVEPTDEVTDEPTAEPTDEATDEPTDVPTDGATGEPTDVATGDPGDVATDEPTPDPTDDATPDPDPSATPDGQYVCLAYTESPAEGGPTFGSGTAQLPFSGAPVGRYAATGLALVLAGSGIVLVARRRAA